MGSAELRRRLNEDAPDELSRAKYFEPSLGFLIDERSAQAQPSAFTLREK